jgi:transposase InsO family protein
MITIIMNDSHIVSIAQLAQFLKHSPSVSFSATCLKEKYAWINETLVKFRYCSLKKKEKGIVKRYIRKMTGLSDIQLKRLLARKKKIKRIVPLTTARHSFPRIYTTSDVARLIETDTWHKRLSGPATGTIFKDQYTIYGDEHFKRLQNISSAHIYNLRKTRQYTSKSSFLEKTKSVSVPIGERTKPDNQGKPGFLRIDTVHQGDYVDGKGQKKGVYHINIVDEVTQWEIVGAVEGISEAFLVPLLQALINQFPFRIINFHSDNGGEYINKIVAKLLNTLLIKQTKSRPRKCNDNALVETKNGTVIRKNMGYAYIPQKYAETINVFYKKHFNPYLNFHRPCGFASRKKDRKGKIRKVYDVYMTPFKRLKSLPTPSKYLKKDVSLEKLENTAMEMSHNESAKSMHEAKEKLFKSFKN